MEKDRINKVFMYGPAEVVYMGRWKGLTTSVDFATTPWTLEPGDHWGIFVSQTDYDGTHLIAWGYLDLDELNWKEG